MEHRFLQRPDDRPGRSSRLSELIELVKLLRGLGDPLPQVIGALISGDGDFSLLVRLQTAQRENLGHGLAVAINETSVLESNRQLVGNEAGQALGISLG